VSPPPPLHPQLPNAFQITRRRGSPAGPSQSLPSPLLPAGGETPPRSPTPSPLLGEENPTPPHPVGTRLLLLRPSLPYCRTARLRRLSSPPPPLRHRSSPPPRRVGTPVVLPCYSRVAPLPGPAHPLCCAGGWPLPLGLLSA